MEADSIGVLNVFNRFSGRGMPRLFICITLRCVCKGRQKGLMMNKENILRTIRFIGMLCAIYLSVIGALGIDVPSIQEVVPASWTAVIVAVASALANHWYNNNYTAGAKMAQPMIKEFNNAIKNEVNDMGKGDENE